MGSGVYNTIAGLWYKVDHVEYEVTARFPLPHRQVSPNPVRRNDEYRVKGARLIVQCVMVWSVNQRRFSAETSITVRSRGENPTSGSRLTLKPDS